MPDLPKRTLGRTGLQVTTLGFGALELRGMVAGIGRPLTPGQPERILQAVLDAGINYIDVAVDYGEAEEHIGRCIAGRRHEFFLASKCGCPLDVSRFSPSERTRYGTPLPRLHDYSRQHHHRRRQPEPAAYEDRLPRRPPISLQSGQGGAGA